MMEGIKASADFNILSLQSEFSANEMGKITAILSDTQRIDINRAAADDFIRTLKSENEERKDKPAASALSDDDFRSFAKNLKGKK